MKVKFSDTAGAIRQRIRRLPQLTREMADTTSKKDAVGIIETFRAGIRDKTFNLIALSVNTIQKKQREGKPKPATPLYGAGEGKKNSLINVLRLRRIKNGWRVFQSGAKHHESRLPLKFMLAVHEAGAVIDMGTHIIRIPPRPVREKAFKRYLRTKSRAENIQQVRDAINQYIRTGELSAVKKYNRNTNTRRYQG